MGLGEIAARFGIATWAWSREGGGVRTLTWKQRGGLLLGVVALGVMVWWLFFLRGFGAVTLATGPEGGTYRAMGSGFSEFVSEGEGRFAVEVLPSQGTAENLRLLEEGKADFAIVQNGQVRSDEVRVVAKLYTEVLHVVVREDEWGLVFSELKGRRLNVGEAGSGSRLVSLELLAHFGCTEFEEVSLPPRKALQALRAGEIDAVFSVTALQSELVREAVQEGGLAFLNLKGANAGLVARFPYLVQATIPAMTYRCPEEEAGAMPPVEVATVGVPSLLVCREGVPAELVYEVTEKLFESRSHLAEETAEAYQIAEVSSEDLLPWAVHEGAQRYFKRREPGFLERYAEVMAFLMSLAAASWAVWGTVSRWSARKKKNRIDDYYLEVAAAFLRLDEEELSAKSLAEERGRLRALRSRAFKELAAEKLKADDSFEIFQNQLALCLDDVRRREERLGR